MPDYEPTLDTEITVSPTFTGTSAAFETFDLFQRVREFKRQYGLKHIIALSGGVEDSLTGIDDEGLQKKLKQNLGEKRKQIVSEVMERLSTYKIAILSGGTKDGLPETAVKEARRVGLKTIGIFPDRGGKYALDDLDLRICVKSDFDRSQWGDESSIFAKLLDGMIVYNGSAGTLIEVAHVLKINDELLSKKRAYEKAMAADMNNDLPQEKSAPLKLIVPIAGTGGVADGLPFIWAKPDVRAMSMPAGQIENGTRAAQYLIDKLFLEDSI